MRAYQSNRFGAQKGYERPTYRQNQAPHKSAYATIYDVTLGWILRKLWLGLKKLFIALKYRFHRSSGGALGRWRFSWFKLGLAVIAIFIIFKKDIQFSINMRAPEANPDVPSEQVAKPTAVSKKANEMSMPNPIAMIAKEREVEVSVDELDEQRVKAYIHRFTKVAKVEMQKFGIPASVKMAQGIIESRAGAVENEEKTNNHFGAPLANQPYKSAWENWRAHSLLLRGSYPQLFEHGSSYRNWAKALKELEYSKDKRYDEKLIETIEKYQLYLLDE